MRKKYILKLIGEIEKSCDNEAIYHLGFSSVKLSEKQKYELEQELKQRIELFCRTWIKDPLFLIKQELI